jgi:hypothetical protein
MGVAVRMAVLDLLAHAGIPGGPRA